MAEPLPSRRLDGAEVLADRLVRELLGQRLVATFATIDPDGTPHAVAVWVAATDRALVVSTGAASRKVANVTRDPRATIMLHDSRPGFEVCGASIVCDAEIVVGASALPLVELVHRRYLTEAGERLPAVAEFAASDDAAILLRPVRALTWDERGSAAAAALREHGGALPLEPNAPRATLLSGHDPLSGTEGPRTGSEG